MERLNITLDPRQGEKLSRLAARMHIQPGTLAPSLLSSAIEDADPDARNVLELLDGIPGASERAQLGLEQARVRVYVRRVIESTTPDRCSRVSLTGPSGR
jgi:hypothetical protein